MKINSFFLIVTITLYSSILNPLKAYSQNNEKPNILIILTDDQGYGDLGCYGSTTIETPNIDKLAGEGMKFTSFYVQPVCGPSRSALLTGRYPVRSKGWGMPASEITFADLLSSAGYVTGCIGKWDVSGRKDIPGRVPNDKGFDYYWGPLGANDAGFVRIWHNRDTLGVDRDMAGLTRKYTDKAIDFIRKNKNEPFLLYLAHTMPHTIIDASPEFKGKSDAGLYGDVIEELDHHTGRLIDEIDRLGLKENTIIIYTSDNGPWCNDQEYQRKKNAAKVDWEGTKPIVWGSAGPLREGKGSNYEGGVRVPCIVRWPGKTPAGVSSDAIFASIDFLPTFVNLAGASIPSDRIIDGVDQTDLITGKIKNGNRDTYFYQSGAHGVRKGKWKLLKPGRKPGKLTGQRRRWPKDYGTNGIELYNLREDIGEKNNLADQYPEIVQELMELTLQEKND